MKRPWSPGPWSKERIAFGVRHYPCISEDRLLASKAPEFAELAIRLIAPDAIQNLYEIVADAEKLLREVEYHADTD